MSSDRAKFLRINESSDLRKIRLKKQNILTKENISNESPDQTRQRLKKQNILTKENISNESPEQNQARLNAQRKRQQNYIENQSDSDRETRMNKDNAAHKIKNHNVTSTEKEERCHLGKIKNQENKFKLKTYNIAYNCKKAYLHPDFKQIELGKMDQICNNCGALCFKCEVNSNGIFMKCCENGKIRIPIIKQYHPFLIELLEYDSNASKTKDTLTFYQEH